MKITKLDINQESARKEVLDYLVPHETRALFLLGNLLTNFKPGFIYAAKESERIVGFCGYYPTFHSCTIFSESSEVSRAFAQIVLEKHSDVNHLLGMSEMIKPAYSEFVKAGRRPGNAPEKDFFELEIENFKPFFISEGSIRTVAEKDLDAVVRIMRQIHHVPADAPITEEERIKVRAVNISFCLEVDGKIVTIASSNGLAIHAFQILGVGTDPSYQRRGYAKAVCSHLIQVMQKKGAQRAVIFTGTENFAARKCYLDLGFQITDKYYCATFESVQH